MKNFFKDESGQGMVEYGLIIALIAIAVIGALKLLSPAIEDIFGDAQKALEDSVSTNGGGGTNGGGDGGNG